MFDESSRSADVMDLIARVLSFTDAQKEIVGLKVAGKSLVASILSSIVGVPTVAAEDIEVPIVMDV